MRADALTRGFGTCAVQPDQPGRRDPARRRRPGPTPSKEQYMFTSQPAPMAADDDDLEALARATGVLK
uniref:hypothetical protein n=1 Tax=Amycolatopsis sp. CA-290885 TaxID=3239925 RepID=UPI003F49681C